MQLITDATHSSSWLTRWSGFGVGVHGHDVGAGKDPAPAYTNLETALGAAARAQGRFQPVQSLVFPARQLLRVAGRIPQVAQTERLDGQGAHQNPGHAGHPFLCRRAGLHQTGSAQAQVRRRAFSPQSPTLYRGPESRVPPTRPTSCATSAHNSVVSGSSARAPASVNTLPLSAAATATKLMPPMSTTSSVWAPCTTSA